MAYTEPFVQLKVNGLPCTEHILFIIRNKRKTVACVQPRRTERVAIVAKVNYQGC